MIEPFESLFSTALLRILERRPNLDHASAVSTLVEAAKQAGFVGLEQGPLTERIESLAQLFSRHGVLNPAWLAARGLTPHFFLINADISWFEHLLRQSEERKERISQYILFGDWDSLVIFYGSDQEAHDLRQYIEGIYGDLTYFGTSQVALLYGYEPSAFTDPESTISVEQINDLVLTIDDSGAVDRRHSLEALGVLLGPTWIATSGKPYGVTAFVGIMVLGREAADPEDVLATLRAHPDIEAALLHLFEVDRGRPFHYFGKVTCRDISELDAVTDAIGSVRLGSLRFECTTLVVANGLDQIPFLPPGEEKPSQLGILSSEKVEGYLMKELVEQLGSGALADVERLDPSFHLLLIHTVDDLRTQLADSAWDDRRHQRLAAAARLLEGEILKGELAQPTGAVVECATAVESYLKHLLRRLIERVYEGDFAAAQNTLKLKNKDLRKVPMGNILVALQLTKEIKEFSFIRDVLGEEWMERLERFVDKRNRWAHDSLPREWRASRLIDEARLAIIEGIEIVRWIGGVVLPIVSAKVPGTEAGTDGVSQSTEEPPKGASGGVGKKVGEERAQQDVIKREGREMSGGGRRRFGVFISHASEDKDKAERIATTLKSLNYDVWYDKWSIGPGDEILGRVEEGLAENDTVVVLLSPHSVESRWVRQELSSAVGAQLSGQQVSIIPIKIEEVVVPGVLKSRLYIDMAKDFEEGVLELIAYLRKKRRTA